MKIGETFMEEKSLNRTQLCKATEAPGYLVIYLKDCGKLPIVKESQGRGYPTLYHPDAIKVVKDHLAKRVND
jgi:hypothetical protein|tara:strand:- start:706 stop:921 length:216 start_codon:yes stop_codon:yes gene_type:complete